MLSGVAPDGIVRKAIEESVRVAEAIDEVDRASFAERPKNPARDDVVYRAMSLEAVQSDAGQMRALSFRYMLHRMVAT